MRTRTMRLHRECGLRRLLHALAVLALTAVCFAAVAVAAQEVQPPTAVADDPAAGTEKTAVVEDRIFTTRALAGYRYADSEDNRAFLQPYDPLESGPVFGFDLFYLTPSFGTLTVEAGYRDTDDWEAGLDYGHGADVDFQVRTQKFTHARDHQTLPEEYKSTGSHGAFDGESSDADASETYADTLENTQVSLKVRAPGYPAHFRASGRVYEHTGTQQITYFFRSCSTDVCHVNSRTRTLDQVTQEYTLGVDAHAGPIDVAYNRTFLTFRDRADDPVDAFGNMAYKPGQSSAAGDYTHDVNPDRKSFKDSVKLNSNLANRMVFSLAYNRQEQENETSGITRGDQSAALEVSYHLTPRLFAAAHLDYQQERTLALSDAAEATRVTNNAQHITSGYSHQHVVKPRSDRWGGEVALRYVPRTGAMVRLRAGHRVNERYAIINKKNGVWDDSSTTTGTTSTTLDGQWRFGRDLTLDGTLGQEWTADPAYATETTSLTRYGLGATWAPTPAFSLRTSYLGYSGKNDDAEAIQTAYAKLVTEDENFSRSVSGNAVSLAATFAPGPTLTFTAAYTFSDNGIEQDMRFGSLPDSTFTYVSPDTEWSGRTQVADLRAAWSASKRLKFTGEAVWVDGHESYDPNFSADADLEELGTAEIAKIYTSLGAEVSVSKAVCLTLIGFWTVYDDKQDDEGDGNALGILATIDVRL